MAVEIPLLSGSISRRTTPCLVKPPLIRPTAGGSWQRGTARKAWQSSVRFPEPLPDRGRFGQGQLCDMSGLSRVRPSAAAISVFRTLGYSELSDCFWPNHDIQPRDRRGYCCAIFCQKPPLQSMSTAGNQSSGTAPITVSTIWRLRRSSASRKALREPNLPHATAEGPR